MKPVSFALRPIRDEEVSEFRRLLGISFGNDPKPEGDDRFRKLHGVERTVAAFDGETMVGTLGDFALRMTVPGGAQISTGGTTMVTVLPTHTRRGILRSMIRQHLDNAVDRGDPAAALWASEPAIYGRFGFGLATEMHEVRVDARHLSGFPAGDDIELTMVPPADVPNVVGPFWHHIGQSRSGFIDRDEPRWNDLLTDPDWMRGDGTTAKHVIARRGDEIVGYLHYRQKSKWTNGLPEGTVVVHALVSSNIDAHFALWRYATTVDLFPVVEYEICPVDDPFAYAVGESREVRRLHTDAMFVRLLNLETALGARTYEQDGEIVIKVSDAMGYVDGTYHLSVSNGQGSVQRTDAVEDVSLDVRELGALYLGRSCCDMYAQLGLIMGDEAAIRRLGQLFVTVRAPWCPEVF